jgi:hypothetical protein
MAGPPQGGRSMTISTGLSAPTGLAAGAMRGAGTLIAFATAPGQVALDGEGGNSPFTRALLDNLGEANAEISVALTKVRAQVADLTKKKQSPWASTNLTGLFYMNQTAAVAATTRTDAAPERVATADPGASLSGGNAVEMEFWRSVKDSNRPEELNAYVVRYPDGMFSSIARARIAALNDPKTLASRSASSEPVIDPATKTAEANIKTEQSIDLDRDARRGVQRRLKALGFATPVSGKFNDETRRAISNWQSVRGYTVSGFLNDLQYTALKAEALPKTAEKDEDEDEKPARNSRRRSGGGGSGGGGGGGGGGFAPGAAGAFIGGAIFGGAMRRR